MPHGSELRIIAAMVTSRWTRVATQALAVCCTLLPLGCAGGEDVTAKSLEQARRLWSRAGIEDYDLEWESSGLNQAHYRVTVRGGRVRTVVMVQPDGQLTEVHPAEPKFYSVEGLFITLAEELAQLKGPTPFGRPKGTKAILRFTPDAKLGYPRSYRRDVVGASRGVAIDVVRFVPNPPPVGSANSP